MNPTPAGLSPAQVVLDAGDPSVRYFPNRPEDVGLTVPVWRPVAAMGSSADGVPTLYLALGPQGAEQVQALHDTLDGAAPGGIAGALPDGSPPARLLGTAQATDVLVMLNSADFTISVGFVAPSAAFAVAAGAPLAVVCTDEGPLLAAARLASPTATQWTPATLEALADPRCSVRQVLSDTNRLAFSVSGRSITPLAT